MGESERGAADERAGEGARHGGRGGALIGRTDVARCWRGCALMGRGAVVVRQGGSLGLLKNMNGWTEVKD